MALAAACGKEDGITPHEYDVLVDALSFPGPSDLIYRAMLRRMPLVGDPPSRLRDMLLVHWRVCRTKVTGAARAFVDGVRADPTIPLVFPPPHEMEQDALRAEIALKEAELETLRARLAS